MFSFGLVKNEHVSGAFAVIDAVEE